MFLTQNAQIIDGALLGHKTETGGIWHSIMMQRVQFTPFAVSFTGAIFIVENDPTLSACTPLQIQVIATWPLRPRYGTVDRVQAFLFHLADGVAVEDLIRFLILEINIF